MTSTKPYLLRAIFEWAEDNNLTPQVLVNAELADVVVPVDHIVDGQIVLNISSSAVKLKIMDNECLSFSARFSGVEQDIFLPVDAVLAIFARENAQGIYFEDIDRNGSEPDTKLSSVKVTNKKKSVDTDKSSNSKKSHLKIIK